MLGREPSKPRTNPQVLRIGAVTFKGGLGWAGRQIVDNHANQLNPMSDAYRQSRGYDARPEEGQEQPHHAPMCPDNVDAQANAGAVGGVAGKGPKRPSVAHTLARTSPQRCQLCPNDARESLCIGKPDGKRAISSPFAGREAFLDQSLPNGRSQESRSPRWGIILHDF